MNKKAVLSAIGVIVLGAAGSALWDVLRPLLQSLGAQLANISSLGFETLRDDLYARAATTFGRPVGLGAALAVLMFLTLLVTVAIMQVLALSVGPRGARFARLYMVGYLGTAMLCGVQLVRTSYVMQLAHYYENLEVVAAPLLSELELKQFRSSFSQVRTRGDFLKITDVLASKIRQSGASPPSPP